MILYAMLALLAASFKNQTNYYSNHKGGQIMVEGIHHISAFTKSAADNHYFYTEILGLRLVKNTVNQQNTQMRHLFYGDYQGNPGTLLTFFELKKVGQAVKNNNYFSSVTLKVPRGSLPYWETRLTDYAIPLDYNSCKQVLDFKDNDSLSLSLMEVNESIALENATHHSDIPVNKQIIGIGEISLRVEQPDETVSFLTDYLGLSPSHAIGQLAIKKDSSFTTVKASNQTAVSRMGRGSIDHIAYSVDSITELDRLQKTAKQHQLAIELYADRGYFQSLYLLEPNGLRIEIATNKPGFTLDEPLDELGERVSLPPFLETKRSEIEANLEGF